MRRTRIDISLPIPAKEGLEELGTNPVVAALAQQMAPEAVQHLEGLHVLIADIKGNLLDLLFDQESASFAVDSNREGGKGQRGEEMRVGGRMAKDYGRPCNARRHPCCDHPQ